MKQSEYIPISVREKIEDKNIVKIVDYLERNAKDFEYIKELEEFSVLNFLFTPGVDFAKIYDKGNQVIWYGPTKLLADNIVGIWGSLKNM